MVRKVKNSDVPKRHKWLYELSEVGFVKALMMIWGICIVVVLVSIALLKWFLTHFK